MPDYLPAKVVPVFRRLCRWVPQGIVVNSEHTLATLHLPASKPVRVAYPGVVPPEDVRPEPPGPPVVGIVGRLAPWKGQHVFLEAAARVREVVPGVRFRIIGSALFGEDDYEARLRRQVSAEGLAGAVEFAGFTNDIWSAIGELTLVAHASTTPEPFGQVVVEAMAAGRSVIATDAGGVRETMVNGDTGLLVSPGDAQAMADAVLKLLRNPQERRDMASAGRKRALSHFHIEQTSQACSELIREVLSRQEECS